MSIRDLLADSAGAGMDYSRRGFVRTSNLSLSADKLELFLDISIPAVKDFNKCTVQFEGGLALSKVSPFLMDGSEKLIFNPVLVNPANNYSIVLRYPGGERIGYNVTSPNYHQFTMLAGVKMLFARLTSNTNLRLSAKFDLPLDQTVTTNQPEKPGMELINGIGNSNVMRASGLWIIGEPN